MGDLAYATLVIIIIWGGIFVYLTGQNRRLKRLEEIVAGMSGRGAADREEGSHEPGHPEINPPETVHTEEEAES